MSTKSYQKIFSKDYFTQRFGNDPKRQKSFIQERELINKYVDSGNLLDVGCSTGEFIQSLNWKGKVFGMEISEYAIAIAKKNGIRFDKNLLNTKNFFNLIIFRGTIQHLDTPFLYLKKAYSSIKPGGFVVFTATPNANSLYYKIWNTLPFLVPEANFFIPSDVTLINTMKNFGFELKEVRYPYLTSPYASYVSDHLNFIKKLLGFKVKFAFWRNSMELVFQKPSKGIGDDMYRLVTQLFPICRSITGDGVRATLKKINNHIPIKIHEVPSGTQVFDWTVPNEWNITDAYIMDESGAKIVDFKKNNLHVVGYSAPVDKYLSLSMLQKHLFSLEDQPDAIPYITSYYSRRWGFCLSHNDRIKLKKGKYHCVINSTLKKGSLTYADLIIPGDTQKEVLISTYVCHPSMANDQLSGPAVVTFLAQYIARQPRRYTYRIVFIPETIGSITYLSRHLHTLKSNVIAGFNVVDVGDERTYSIVRSRYGQTLADKVLLNVLNQNQLKTTEYSYLDSSSDERQYCSPGVDLPLVCFARSIEYPEYHTSLDNLSLVTPEGLFSSFEVLTQCIDLIEENHKYKATCLCEPQLGKRGLYPTLSTKKSRDVVRKMMNFLRYADGTNDLIDISNITNTPAKDLLPIIEKLSRANLIEKDE